MQRSLDLYLQRNLRLPNLPQKFSPDFKRAFRPSELLRFKSPHITRQFLRHHIIRKKNKFPALELGTITQIQIFTKRVGLPPPRTFNRRSPPHAGASVKIHKATAGGTRKLIDHKMPVYQLARSSSG